MISLKNSFLSKDPFNFNLKIECKDFIVVDTLFYINIIDFERFVNECNINPEIFKIFKFFVKEFKEGISKRYTFGEYLKSTNSCEDEVLDILVNEIENYISLFNIELNYGKEKYGNANKHYYFGIDLSTDCPELDLVCEVNIRYSEELNSTHVYIEIYNDNVEHKYDFNISDLYNIKKVINYIITLIIMTKESEIEWD